MRTSLVLSLLLHALVLTAALVGFYTHNAHEKKLDVARPVTVEMAPPSEVSTVKAGKAEAKPEEAAKQAPPADKPSNIVQTSAELQPSPNDKISQKLAALPPPKPKAPPPEETKEKPKPEAHPDSADKAANEQKATSAVPPVKRKITPKAQPIQHREQPRAAQEPEHHENKTKPNRPRRDDRIADMIDRPTPTAQGESKFDPERIAALLNRDPTAGAHPEQDGPRQPWRKPSSLEEQARGVAPEAREREAYGRPDGRDGRMSANDIDAFRAQISRCWTPPIGGLGSAPLIVKLHIMLNEDGTLSQAPQVTNGDYSPFFRPAADAATRAVMQCQPYRMPPEKYGEWRDMLLNFDPSQIYGG